MNSLDLNQNIFDLIAPGWYNFRHWTIFRPELEALAKRWEKGGLLNIGCAHGPDFLPFKEGFELYGIDSSPEMIRLAHKYSQKFNFTAELQVADARYLPYADNIFDWTISVAALHHIKDKGEREAAFAEMRRVLKPGGEAFITVWNRFQPRFWSGGKEVMVPWKAQGETLYRYYYLFSYPEVEKLVKKVGFKLLRAYPESSFRFPLKFFSRNICLLVKK